MLLAPGLGRTLSRMPFPRRTPRTTVLGGAAALGLSLLAVLAPQPAQAHHAGASPGPVNAQTTYGWGRPQWQDDFVGHTKSFWHRAGQGDVQNQHGMLTLNTARRGGTSATLERPGHATGRWETRLRSRRYGSGATNYTVMTQLVPAGGRAQHCGARNIALESYRLGGGRAGFFIRNLPARQFTDSQRLNLANDRWHTYAVEVTAKRISWFVDAHVITSERRPAALSGVPLTVRYTMAARRGAAMNQSRMQMDWLRYFDLSRPDRKSVAAPRAQEGRYAGAC
jgi:hypothetical protein